MIHPFEMFQNLFTFLDKTPIFTSYQVYNKEDAVYNGWVKRTSENLSEVLSNYQEIQQLLFRRPYLSNDRNFTKDDDLYCWLNQLTSVKPEIFPKCRLNITKYIGL